jgi:hypothetical protein
MGEILGLGVTHYPGLIVPDEQMDTLLKRALASDSVPLELKDPTSWPEPMRREWEANRDGLAARDHRRRLVEAFRRVHKRNKLIRSIWLTVWLWPAPSRAGRDALVAACGCATWISC